MATDESSIALKTCTKCHETKPETAFSFDRTPANPERRRLQCRQCMSAQQRTRNQLHPQKHRDSARKYYHENIEERHAYSIKYNQSHKEHISDYHKNYYQKNRERLVEWQRQWRETHREQDRKASRSYGQRHKRERRIYNARYRKENPDTIHAVNARRLARERNASVKDLTKAQWLEIKKSYNNSCVYCGKKIVKLEMDHIIPISKGGGHTFSNIVPACKSCNSRKNAGPPLKPVQPLLLTLAPAKKPRN